MRLLAHFVPAIFLDLGVLAHSPPGLFFGLGYYHILAQKVRLEQLLKIIKTLNYNKSSCIIFVLNIFEYILSIKRIETF